MLVHVWDPIRAHACLKYWARPRCFFGKCESGECFVDVVPMFFTASPRMHSFNWNHFNIDHQDVIFLTNSTPDAQRTETALRAVAWRHPSASWIFKGDDDTFVDVSRLTRTLLLYNSSLPYLLGRADHEWGRFASGGAGYALSRAAFFRLMPHLSRFVAEFSVNEDVMIAECVRMTVSQNALTDIPGFNWHRPENLLARRSFRDIDAHASPITYHYITPERMESMMQPRIPHVLLQVWPFDAAPVVSDKSLLRRFQDNVWSCERVAAAAGLSYRLVNMRDVDLTAAFYSGYLDSRGRELLYTLNLAYLEGGIVVSVWTPCDEQQVTSLLSRITDASASLRQGLVHDPQKSSNLGAPGHTFICVRDEASACALIAATQYNHKVFQLLARLSRVVFHRNASFFNNQYFGAQSAFVNHWAMFSHISPVNLTSRLQWFLSNFLE